MLVVYTEPEVSRVCDRCFLLSARDWSGSAVTNGLACGTRSGALIHQDDPPSRRATILCYSSSAHAGPVSLHQRWPPRLRLPFRLRTVCSLHLRVAARAPDTRA